LVGLIDAPETPLSIVRAHKTWRARLAAAIISNVKQKEFIKAYIIRFDYNGGEWGGGYNFSFQSRTVLSSEPEARSLPSDENDMLRTLLVWQLSALRAAPVARSQSRTVPYSEPEEARSLPSGENAMP
jgi:hypothetical protein